MGKTSDAANSLPAQLELVREKLTDSGEAVAATRGGITMKCEEDVTSGVGDGCAGVILAALPADAVMATITSAGTAE